MQESKSKSAARKRCRICDKSFPKRGNKVYCSPECSSKALKQQLKALSERRRHGRKQYPKTACAICTKPFQRRHLRHIYCSDPCREVGLQKAVERQKDRREEAKRIKIAQRGG